MEASFNARVSALIQTLSLLDELQALIFLLAKDLTSHQGNEESVYTAEQERLLLELQAALARAGKQERPLRVCAWCKRVRDDAGGWKRCDDFIRERFETTITHGLCPDCGKKVRSELGRP